MNTIIIYIYIKNCSVGLATGKMLPDNKGVVDHTDDQKWFVYIPACTSKS